MNTPARKGVATFTNVTVSEALNSPDPALDVPQEAAFTLDELDVTEFLHTLERILPNSQDNVSADR